LARARPSVAHGRSIPVCSRCRRRRRCAPQCVDAAPARTATAVPWSPARKSGCAASAPFVPTRPVLTRGVAGQTSHGSDAGGASPRTARRVFFGSFRCKMRLQSVFRMKTHLRRMTEPSACAARGDRARRCRGGVARGRQGEDVGRLVCRPPASRQGAVSPMRTVVCAGVPLGPPRAPHTAALEYPGVPRMREYSITLGVLTQLSTVEHSLARAGAGVFLPSHRGGFLRARCCRRCRGVP
jgi:hypothetical protein